MGLDAEQWRMVGWPDRRFLDLVGTKYPIIQAPMANVAGVDLCVGAAKAGALGSLPCGMITPDQVREQVLEVRRQVDAPINLNFFCFDLPAASDDREWRKVLRSYYVHFGILEPEATALRMPFDEAYCAVVEEVKPEVVSFHFGLPTELLFERVKATDALVFGCATTVDEAFFLDQCGVDAIVAQGFEAGDLIFERDVDEIPFDHALPFTSAAGRATSVDRDDDEALIGQPLMQEIRPG